MGVMSFQAPAWMKALDIVSGGERGGSAGAVLFICRAIPLRQMGVKKIGEHGLAMLQTSIADTAHYHEGLVVSISSSWVGLKSAYRHHG